MLLIDACYSMCCCLFPDGVVWYFVLVVCWLLLVFAGVCWCLLVFLVVVVVLTVAGVGGWCL